MEVTSKSMLERTPQRQRLWQNVGFIVKYGRLSEMDAEDAQLLVRQLCQILKISPTVNLDFASQEDGSVTMRAVDQGEASSRDLCRLIIALYDLSYAAGEFKYDGEPEALVWCPFENVVQYYNEGFSELQYRPISLYDASMMLASAIQFDREHKHNR